MKKFIDPLRDTISRASSAIMEIYQEDFSVYEKDDKSPLTEADLVANEIIISGLREFSDYPVLSEEGKNIPWSTRKNWSRYWLVDPIDGTKEFINKNGEFTVNIALIENGKSIVGVVAVPAQGVIYFGIDGDSAWKENSEGERVDLHVSESVDDVWRVVGSRSHNSVEAIALVDKLSKAEFISMGSSLKLCAIAEGKADIYPRFGLTSEWDTAAAQAVVEAAGGQVLKLSLNPLQYNTKESLLNPYFIVCAKVDEEWSEFVLDLNKASL